MAVGAVWRCAIVWTFGGVARPMVNVLHYRQLTSTVAADDVTDVELAVELLAVQYIAAVISDAFTCNLIQIRGISDPTAGGDFAVSPGIQGALTGQTYSPQCSQLIAWKTGLIGRHYQGRNFLPPPTEGEVNGAGALSSGQMTALDAAATGLEDLAGGGSHAAYDLVVYSAPTTTPVAWGGAITNVNSHSVRDHLKTQRRRSL